MNHSNNTRTVCFILTFLFLMSLNTFETKAQSKLKSAITNLFKGNKKKHFTKAFSNINEGKEIEQDGFELSVLQEIEKTKDPALGYPPTERLQIVRDLVDHAISARGIQGIQWSERGPTTTRVRPGSPARPRAGRIPQSRRARGRRRPRRRCRSTTA